MKSDYINLKLPNGTNIDAWVDPYGQWIVKVCRNDHTGHIAWIPNLTCEQAWEYVQAEIDRLVIIASYDHEAAA